MSRKYLRQVMKTLSGGCRCHRCKFLPQPVVRDLWCYPRSLQTAEWLRSSARWSNPRRRKGQKHEGLFDCPNCSSTARLKNNTEIVTECCKHKALQETDPTKAWCQTPGCFAQGCSPHKHPEFYWKFGKAARRHKCSDKNRLVFEMLCNGLPLSKIAKITEMSYRDISARIEFFYDQIRSFTTKREDFAQVVFHRDVLTVRHRQPNADDQLADEAIEGACSCPASLHRSRAQRLHYGDFHSVQADEEDIWVAFRERARI